jgi:hypothetical protein
MRFRKRKGGLIDALPSRSENVYVETKAYHAILLSKITKKLRMGLRVIS